MRRLMVSIVSVTFFLGAVLLPTAYHPHAQENVTLAAPAGEGQEAASPDNKAAGGVQAGVPEGMELVSQNDKLALYYNSVTTEIAVENLESGKLWYSNSPDRESDPRAEALIKSRLGSQLQFYYYSKTGSTNLMDNYIDSIAKGQFSHEIDNGRITVNYDVGDMSSGLTAPKRIAVKRFEEEILPSVKDENERDMVKKSYRLVKESGFYEMWGNLTRNKRDQLQEIMLKNNYTKEDFDRDNKENGIILEQKASFKAAIEYRLDGDSLVVRVPLSKVQYDPSFPLLKLSVLPYFGAAGTEDNGYMLVPDGSGALINLNNRKTSALKFSAKIYGKDMAINERKSIEVTETARMPVFGMKQGTSAMLAIIEEGDTLANVEADVSGRTHSYNEIYSSYDTLAQDEIELSGNGIRNNKAVFQERMHLGDIVIRYKFLDGSAANYSGMAGAYRDYLVEKYGMNTLEPAEKSPFFLELLGAIPKKTTFIGIPYTKTIPLTTYKQAEDIVLQLKKAGIENIKLRYLGWMNGGMLQSLPVNVKPVSKLGRKSGFEALAAFLEKEKIAFYPNVNMLQFYDKGWHIGNNPNSSLFINQQSTLKYPLILPTRVGDVWYSTGYYLTAPHRLPDIVRRFTDAYGVYKNAGLSLGDFGDIINSDFREGGIVDRQEAKAVNREQMKALSESFPDLLVSGGNVSMAPYYKSAVRVPVVSSGYQIADESVPFYEMVFHGYVDYAGEPVNTAAMTEESRDNLLKMLETGSNLYYQWSYEASSAVKDTEFNYLYSSCYTDWLEDAVSWYNEISGFLGKVRHLPITGHEKLADGVYRTTYGGKLAVTVNYNNAPVTVQGVTLAAKAFKIGGGN